MPSVPVELQSLHAEAYAAFERGALGEALPKFRILADANPGRYAYMLGLTHKYRREWQDCIDSNLRAIASSASDDGLEAEHWNIAIAATALGEWSLAREHWIAAGLDLPRGDAPMDDNRGVVSVRLNAWASGETLYADRIGLARARLRNIPLPESGHRYGDIILIDGAKTGERRYGESTVPVFNELQRLVPSEFITFEARVDCASAEDADALEESTATGIGGIEDWSRSMQFHCKACSYGLPHEHAETEPDASGWIRERHIGIAAKSREAADSLLQAWVEEGRSGLFLERLARRRPRRAVMELEEVDAPVPEVGECEQWWVAPDESG
jgi:hypothetical protein